jgi:hypothetical protein
MLARLVDAYGATRTEPSQSTEADFGLFTCKISSSCLNDVTGEIALQSGFLALLLEQSMDVTHVRRLLFRFPDALNFVRLFPCVELIFAGLANRIFDSCTRIPDKDQGANSVSL